MLLPVAPDVGGGARRPCSRPCFFQVHGSETRRAVPSDDGSGGRRVVAAGTLVDGERLVPEVLEAQLVQQRLDVLDDVQEHAVQVPDLRRRQRAVDAGVRVGGACGKEAEEGSE